MIAYLQTNIPQLLAHFEGYAAIEIKQYGAGNLRISGDKDRLLATVGQPIQDGIVQVVADGFKPHFWSGDLYVISDAPGAMVWEASGYSFTLDRLMGNGEPNAQGTRVNRAARNIDSTYQ